MIFRFAGGLAVLASIAVGAWFLLPWKRELEPSVGAKEQLALALIGPRQEPCDLQVQERRRTLARIVDKFQSRIHLLWEARDRNDFPDYRMEQVGPIFLRQGAASKAKRNAFDITHWSWEEAEAAFLRTQSDPSSPLTKQRWRDLETAVTFLLERDAARLLRGKKFLPPHETAHVFRPNAAVERKSARVYEVRLDPGDFAGAEALLAKILEQVWRSDRREVKVKWVNNDPRAYRLEASFRGNRSFVHHKRRAMVIANFAWVSTVAHELGHVLGFDDHYYSVWHEANCYYSQESRLSDLMSNSELGQVTKEHWDLLERAYPWGKSANIEPFSYVFSCLSGTSALCPGK